MSAGAEEVSTCEGPPAETGFSTKFLWEFEIQVEWEDRFPNPWGGVPDAHMMGIPSVMATREEFDEMVRHAKENPAGFAQLMAVTARYEFTEFVGRTHALLAARRKGGSAVFFAVNLATWALRDTAALVAPLALMAAKDPASVGIAVAKNPQKFTNLLGAWIDKDPEDYYAHITACIAAVKGDASLADLVEWFEGIIESRRAAQERGQDDRERNREQFEVIEQHPEEFARLITADAASLAVYADKFTAFAAEASNPNAMVHYVDRYILERGYWRYRNDDDPPPSWAQ